MRWIELLFNSVFLFARTQKKGMFVVVDDDIIDMYIIYVYTIQLYT